MFPRFDPLDERLLDDPYPVLAELRQAGPLCRSGPGTWAVTRHAEVGALLRDRRLGHGFAENSEGSSLKRAFAMAGGAPDLLLRNIVPRLDPAQHARVRRLIVAALSPATVRRMSQSVGDWVDAFLDEALEHGGFDAVTDLAFPLQTVLACDMIRVPRADRAAIVERAIAVGRVFILIPYAAGGGPGAQSEAAGWLRDYVADLLAQRRRAPGDDLLSRLMQVRHNGSGLSDDEIIDNVVFLFFAGFETMLHLIGGGCALLTRHPQAWRQLRDDPGVAASAVEELMRYDPPIQWVARLTSEEVEVAGHTIRPNRAVLLLIGSANRDERVFGDPSRVDLRRNPNPHLSFGSGVHTCLGAVLARSVTGVVFDRLARRVGELAEAGPAVVRPHYNLRGHLRVPVSVK